MNGVDVWLDGDGKFYAEIGTKRVSRVKLADLIKEIAKRSTASVTVMQLHGLNYPPSIVKLVDAELVKNDWRGSKTYQFRTADGHLEKGYHAYHSYDPALTEEMKELDKEARASSAEFQGRYDELATRARKVSNEDIAGLPEADRASHKKEESE